MVKCSVTSCKHYSEQRKCKFMEFPETVKKKKKVNLIRNGDEKQPDKQSLICSCHFKNSDKTKIDLTVNKASQKGQFKFVALKNGVYEMETLETIEENGSGDPLSTAPDSPIASSVKTTENLATPVVVTADNNILQLILPQRQTQVQSVIQPNQQSVIQTAANLQPVLGKSNVFLVSSKPSSVIQTPQGSLQTLRVLQAETASDDSLSDDETAKKRRDSLKRRPSYRKILNDLGAGEITEPKVEQTSSEGDSELSSELSSNSIPYHTVLPATAIQISSGEGNPGLHALTMTNSTAGGTIVQYSPGQEIFVPVVTQGGSISSPGNEDQARKREMRLLKNREAARECRRKKKEYIKCLENRVAVLENQNKTLIEELKELKELYCQHKTE